MSAYFCQKDPTNSVVIIDKNKSLCNGTSKVNASLLCFDSTYTIYQKYNIVTPKTMLNTVIGYPKYCINNIMGVGRIENTKQSMKDLAKLSQKEFHSILDSNIMRE